MRFRDRRLLSLLLVALASVAALALSACGGDGDSGNAKSLLRDAFQKPIKSANVSLDLSASVEGVQQLSQPVTLKLTGPYETRGAQKVPKLDWDVNVSGGGQTFSGGLISTGDNAFISFQGTNYEVGTQLVQQYEQQRGQQQQGANLSFKQFGIDPANWLDDAKTDGDEDVAGAQTTKVTGKVNVEKMLNDINTLIEKAPRTQGQTAQKLTPEQISQAKDAVKNPTFEAFVAKDDKTLRRMTTSLNFDIPENQRAQTQGATGGTIKFSLQFANVGQPVTVQAPADPKPLSELQSQIQGLGGLGGGAGGSGGAAPGGGGAAPGGGGAAPGGGSGSPSSEQFQKYADCLQKASGDQAEIEKCSALIR